MTARHVGILFADISGTTRLIRKIGAAEGARAVERCMKRIERSVEGFRGEVLMPASDEMLAAFASAEDALQAALDMQSRLADLPPVSGIKLTARVGVHFGEAAETPDGLAGTAVEMARTLLSIAGANQIVTCASTAEAVSPSLRRCLHRLDGMTLPGDTGDCQLYEVVWPAGGDVTATVVKPGALAAPPAAPAASGPATGGSPSPANAPTRPATQSGARYCVRFDGKAYLLDGKTRILTIGRDKENDIRIDDRKASRRHAVVELRPDLRIAITDSSTNGTFVASSSGKEVMVHNDTLVVQGSGRLAFGHSTNNAAALIAEFEPL